MKDYGLVVIIRRTWTEAATGYAMLEEKCKTDRLARSIIEK